MIPIRSSSSRARPGYQLAVEFGPDEQIENVAVGDSGAWQVTPNRRGDHLFVKPIQPGVSTNMTVVTNTPRLSVRAGPGLGPGRLHLALSIIRAPPRSPMPRRPRRSTVANRGERRPRAQAEPDRRRRPAHLYPMAGGSRVARSLCAQRRRPGDAGQRRDARRHLRDRQRPAHPSSSASISISPAPSGSIAGARTDGDAPAPRRPAPARPPAGRSRKSRPSCPCPARACRPGRWWSRRCSRASCSSPGSMRAAASRPPRPPSPRGAADALGTPVPPPPLYIPPEVAPPAPAPLVAPPPPAPAPAPPPEPRVVYVPQPAAPGRAAADAAAAARRQRADFGRRHRRGARSVRRRDGRRPAGGSAPTPVTVVGSTATPRVRAGVFANRSTTVPQGTLIPAVLETALDSTRAGFARAIVSRDVRGFDGTRVLIPRGSRLIGEYQSQVSPGQHRALVNWVRLIRPTGVTMAIGSPASDTLGRGGHRRPRQQPLLRTLRRRDPAIGARCRGQSRDPPPAAGR